MIKEAIGDVTNYGEALIKAWSKAKKDSEFCMQQMTKASTELVKCQNELGAWLVPGDAQFKEKFCVWYGDSLIAATFLCDKQYSIEIRTRGRSMA